MLAVVPPDVIWKINMFAFGGLETAFFRVMVCGLFWRRANRTEMCIRDRSGEDPDAGAYLRGSDYYATLDSKGDIR